MTSCLVHSSIQNMLTWGTGVRSLEKEKRKVRVQGSGIWYRLGNVSANLQVMIRETDL